MPNISGVDFEILVSDVFKVPCDAFLLKHAQASYGVDEKAVALLEGAYPQIRAELPPPSGFRLYQSPMGGGPRAFIFLGVPPLRNFLYDEIQDWAERGLSALAARAPHANIVGLTLHGGGFGLDERECFESELRGLVNAVASSDKPNLLRQVVIVELNEGRARRLQRYLDNFAKRSVLAPGVTTLQGASRKSVFVAMPFASEFEDTYEFGIRAPLYDLELRCERIDEVHFVGDVVAEIERRIRGSRFVVADMTGANPNVYRDVGFAWAAGIPTILVAKKSENLHDSLRFDVQGQRCIIYPTIVELSKRLKEEAEALL